MNTALISNFSFGPARFSAEDVARYCRASGDRNPIHVDEDAARCAGLSTCIVPGGMLVFFMENAIKTNFPGAIIIEVRTRFVAPLPIAAPVFCDGREVRNQAEKSPEHRLTRLMCREKLGQVVCMGDLRFALPGDETANQ